MWEFETIWQQIQDHRKQQEMVKTQGAEVEDEFEGKDEEALKKEYRLIAERRVRLGLLLSEIGSSNDISPFPDRNQRGNCARSASTSGPRGAGLRILSKKS